MKNPLTFSLAGLLLLAGCAPNPLPQPGVLDGQWEMSPEYIESTMLKSDGEVAEELHYNQLRKLERKDLPEGVFARFKAMAKKMEIVPLPAIYLDALDDRSIPQAAARFTHEGHASVIVNQTALNEWSDDQLVAVFGHELVHLKEKHVTPENLADAYNHPEHSVENELLADEMGSGPLGSCDPESLKEALQIVFNRDMYDLAQHNHIVSSDDYDSLTGSDHPAHQRRLDALDKMARNLPEGCE